MDKKIWLATSIAVAFVVLCTNLCVNQIVKPQNVSLFSSPASLVATAFSALTSTPTSLLGLLGITPTSTTPQASTQTPVAVLPIASQSTTASTGNPDIGPQTLPQVWFSAATPTQRAAGGNTPNDYFALFAPNAPWQNSLAGMGVYVITVYSASEAPDSELLPLFNFLKAHNKVLALAAEYNISGTDCGTGAGYGGPKTITRAVTRIKQLGGPLVYMLGDSTLERGYTTRTKRGHLGCGYTPQQVAENVASSTAAARAVFPNIIVGDDSPVSGNNPDPDYVSVVEQYVQAYKQITGHSLAFMVLDNNWPTDGWRPLFLKMVAMLKRNNIPVGMYVNATGAKAANGPDVAWTNAAIFHYQYVESNSYIDNGPAFQPDFAIISSWQNYPTHLLPETTPGTLTYLLNQYEQWLPPNVPK